MFGHPSQQRTQVVQNGAETFSHYYHIDNINNSTSPNSLPVIEAGGVDKVDDALNLAIIFHQHQPYYKNKLTDTYEMPWVRVHAMTEYVDSPGILAQTSTKVTYNLVPSFIEQLVDYYENEPLDDHTDMAKRPWPEAAIQMPQHSNYTLCNSSHFGTAAGFTMSQRQVTFSHGCIHLAIATQSYTI